MSTRLDKKIKIKMIEMDVTGAEIARKIDVHRSAINNTIRGRLRSRRLRKAIASALRLKVEDLWPEAKNNK